MPLRSLPFRAGGPLLIALGLAGCGGFGPPAPLYAVQLALKPAPDALPVPVQGVKPGSLRDTWGAARAQGRTHQGIDIFARRGTPVLSATEGLVSSLEPNRLGGTVVWVTGPGRQTHYYAHLDSLAPLSLGQRVLPGTVLGTVGNTGNARGTPTHLHYGIYTMAGAINPYPLLRLPAPTPVPPTAGAERTGPSG